MELVISPRSVLRLLVPAVAALTAMGAAVQVAEYAAGHDYLLGLVPLFDVSSDSSIPTWYASATLFACALLLGAVAAHERGRGHPFVAHWAGLALIFALLSVDEVARIHETIGDTLSLRTGPTRGVFYYAWVIPGAGFVLAVGLVYLRFLLRLPRATARWLVLAGALYVGGALVMEMANAHYHDRYGAENLTYQLRTVFEELLEMGGVVVFLYALVAHAAALGVSARIRLAPRGAPSVRVVEPAAPRSDRRRRERAPRP